MKVYTRTGDAGETALFGSGRVSKADPRVAAYGDVDELNASVGVAAAHVDDAGVREALERVQADLFALEEHVGARRKDRHALGLKKAGQVYDAIIFDRAKEKGDLIPVGEFP